MNKILKSFKNNGDECALDECDYFQLELLTNNAIVLISKKCLDLVLTFKWYLGKDGYAMTYGSDKIKLGARTKLHQLLYKNYNLINKIPSGYVIDHINRDKLDNRLENLRMCNGKQNSYNTSKRKGKFKGVSKTKKSWNASITKDGKTYKIKDIPSEMEAAKIYDLMAEELFGQYAGKNYLDSRH